MQPKSTRPQCPCCKCLFTPDPRSRFHQKFCSKPACQKASKAYSQQQWGIRSGYWRDSDNIEKVQKWRKDHPGYWKRAQRR